MNIEANVKKFLGERAATERNSSFDYCFNYFQSFRNGDRTRLANESNMEFSCLQLGFYLASWGMYRGSSKILEKSLKCLEPVIETIAEAPRKLWETDVLDYKDGGWQPILEFRDEIRKRWDPKLDRGPTPTSTLVTKIMLGVFGCVPAFDQNFTRGFQISTGERVVSLNKKSLDLVSAWYWENKVKVDKSHVSTLVFNPVQLSHKYTRAKIIDMIFFVEGTP